MTSTEKVFAQYQSFCTIKIQKDYFLMCHSGPVVQSIVSLTSSLRGQLVKCFTTLLPNILIFFVEKMREAFAMQKLLTFFQLGSIPGLATYFCFSFRFFKKGSCQLLAKVCARSTG